MSEPDDFDAYRRYHPGRMIWDGLADRGRRVRQRFTDTVDDVNRTVELHNFGRRLTAGEHAEIRWMFGSIRNIDRARIVGHNFLWPYPNDRAMAPYGAIFFPGSHYHDDFSSSSTPIKRRALFMHEATHLYQHFQLRWSLPLRRPFDSNYQYVLERGKPLRNYGVEAMGQLVEEFYLLRHGLRPLNNRYELADYADAVPVRA